jgi:hypothetical protein
MAPNENHRDCDQLNPPAVLPMSTGVVRSTNLRPGRAGALLVRQRVIRDVAGLEFLADQLAGFAGQVLAAIERAEGPQVEFLQTLPAVTLFCVSQKISARARERYWLSASKSDTIDAFVLADTLRHEHRWARRLSVPLRLLRSCRRCRGTGSRSNVPRWRASRGSRRLQPPSAPRSAGHNDPVRTPSTVATWPPKRVPTRWVSFNGTRVHAACAGTVWGSRF